MGYMDEYNKLKKKREEEEKKASTEKKTSTKADNSVNSSYMNEYRKLREKDGYQVIPAMPVDAASYFATRTRAKKEETKEDDGGFDLFQKGAFEDGVTASNVGKAILGTLGDAALNVAQGFGGLFEGVSDAITYAGAYVGDALGFDEWADRTRDQARFNAIGDWTDDLEDSLDKHSVLGSTSSSIMEGVGQVGGILLTGGTGGALGLGSAGVTALTSGTMGLSGFGSGIGEAYEGGATDLEALKHGLNVGATDTISELIFGGLGKGINALGFSKGLSSADDMVAKALSSKFKGQMSKNLVEFGIKSGAEGLEEVIAGVAQAYSKSRTYLKDEDFFEILKDENLLEQFVVGSMTSGIMQAPSFVSSTANGKDFITGQTQNEQAVIKKEVENRIAEAEKNGKKLTAKEKSDIEAKVEKDMERGYISTDTIESVLGGENYKGYKSLTEQENTLKERQEALQTEIETLQDSDNTIRNNKKLQEAEAELEKVTAQLKSLDVKSAKSKLSQDVRKMVQNDRLVESYREQERAKQDFKADFEKYKGTKHEEAAKKTLESAIKAEANNTNAVHDLVDFAAHISAESGKVVEFKTDEEIVDEFVARQTKEIAKFEALENRSAEQDKYLAELKDQLEKVKSGEVFVDGNITGDTIVLNIGSKDPNKKATGKPLNRIIGHEVTHSVEKAKSYDKLRDHLFAYAKSKGVDIDAEIAKRKLKYEGIKDANPEAELVADLVGDYLFTDSDFVNKLSTENRNLAQRIYDEIKHLLKMATAGSKEARELERVKHAFENAFREAEQNRASKTHTETKYSVSNGNIKDYSTGYAYDEYYFTMAYEQDGEVVGTLEYGVYEGEPNVKMIEVDPKHRRKGIGTKLLQELQKKYDGKEIKFGMATPDGSKLLDSITYDVTDEAVTADMQKLKDLQAEIADVETKISSFDEFWDNGTITEAQRAEFEALGDRWDELYPAINELEHSLKGKKAKKTFVKTDADTKYSVSEANSKTLYTGSPVTDIKQFKVGGANGAKQTGDRYGRGIYLTTNKSTAQGYAGDSGRVYEINADDLNIFNLNDSITEEMKATLRRELNGKDKQFRNSVLRNFRSEKTFTDFESAEKFFDEQRKIWKEEDGYYSANKPEILSADDKTGKAVIEYTDFVNIDNAIGSLDGNQLYDALKSISTDDFASFITGHGFDGIAFDEDADNQQYVIYRNEDRLHITNDGDIAPTQYSLSEGDTAQKINQSMTMQEAKRMIETTFKVNGIAEFYDGEYANADEWLRKEGSQEVEMYVENDFNLYEKYFSSNEDILNGEYSLSDVLDAYLAGTLTGKEKPKPKRLDVSQSTKLEDTKFYSPQKIEDAKATFELANQKAVGENKNEIYRARAEILLFAHNKGAAELLGITQADLNKKLRSWSNYSANARMVSERINAGVAEENRWTGIENSAYISKAKVTNEDIERLVASVEGDSQGYERRYIARVMLAADTHIDYSGLKFKFANSQQVNADHSGLNGSGRVLGFYDDSERLIEVSHDKPNTVAHEMGHYIDAQWGRDLLGTDSSHLFLTRRINEDMVRERHGEQGVQFLNNFNLFINSLTDVNQNSDSYYNDRGEVFARFFAKFIEWTDNIATGNKYYSYESTMYKDNFTQAHYMEFAKLLQEKALLDGRVASSEMGYSAPTEVDVAPIKYSLGYHAGDLGKAEGYWNMMSSNRGTGHFGTGTYFVGDEAKISDSHYGNRPHEKVEFDNYHLFKPLLERDGFDLHSALKYINDNIFDYPIAKMSFDEMWDVRKQADEAEYTLWDDDATDAEKAAAQKVLDDFKERFKSVGYDPDRMDAQELYEELNDITKKYHLTRSKLEMIFWRDMSGLSYEEQNTKIDSIIQGIYDEVSQIEDAYAAKYEDSPSTRFVKAMGYEGVDVRGFKGLDNTTYGSVIYDLKGEDLARKQEIGTAKYSMSEKGEDISPVGNYDFYGKDFRKKSADGVAPVAESPVVTDTNVGSNDTEETPVAPVMEEAPVDETVKRKEVESVVGDRDSFVSKQAMELYEEISNLKKGVRASKRLGYLLDHGYEWRSIKTALLNIRDNPNQVVNPNSAAESVAREMIGREYDAMVEDFSNAEGVTKNIYTKMQSLRTELENNQKLREQSNVDFDSEIARLQAEYEAKKNKNTKLANDILRRIERVQRLKSQVDADYGKRIGKLEERLEKMSKPEYKTAMQRKAKHNEYSSLMENLVGDTSTWVDKKLGLSYKVNTLRRNLRDIVRDANGKQDIAKADAIYDELQGNYNHNEAELKRESMRIKKVFQDLKLNHAEDTYAHMLGEFRHNPKSKLTEEDVKEFYEKNKKNINTTKVDKAIEESRKVFDELIVRVNERLKEQGMKEIPYRKGYFPHFTNPKQGWVAKFLNWKPVDSEIPTSIAGLTEDFNPERSWQSFNKERKGDTTDYSLEQGLDTYIHGALDWIYHIEDIQKRRALENHIRYVHSDEGVKKKIEEIRNNETYDADEAQALIDAVYAEAKNPLNNFVTDLRAGTNTLANKKSSMDRKTEEMTNRKIYSVMTNLNNRINANMVVGSFSSALTNFIPITQSWMEVSPVYSLKGMRDTIISTIRDDGVVNKSDFLTNRLMNEDKLFQTGWDKVSEKAAFMMEAIDTFTSQTVWRSKYLQNISDGMSETEAIKNADQFAENVIAGRSRGNQPTIFDAKNPLTKIFTAFQLEVNNQYGYMFKDAPQDSKNKARLVKGYATAFLGAYAYNALYSSLVGRDAAFDPISILEDLFKDLFGGDEEEPEEILLNLTDNILEEVPFVGGLVGGGRVPLSSALPYDGDYKTFITDLANKELSTKEMLKPLYYLLMPVGGGQIKKTNEGLGMFSDDHPVSGSYTESGNLRYPVEKNFGNVLQAGLFGQYASKNARDYFDNNRQPLKEKQIQEFIDVDIPIKDYWEYRDGLKGKDTLGEKLAYIDTLDLPISKKNILANNQANRDEPIDMAEWGEYGDLEEFDYAVKYPDKYKFLEAHGISAEEYKNFDDDTKDAYSWAYQNPEKYAVSKAVSEDVVTYRTYTKGINKLEADKDENGKSINGSRKEKVFSYIDSLPLDYGQKCILFRSEYKSDDSMNRDILEYLDSREDISYDEMVTILTELGFTVNGNNVYWD